METGIINTNIINEEIGSTERRKDIVTGPYTEVYLNDNDSEFQKLSTEINDDDNEAIYAVLSKETWKSPSDYLVGLLATAPPFTSKILRSKTHNGILACGDNLLNDEFDEFDTILSEVIEENEAAWKVVLEHEFSSINDTIENGGDGSFVKKSKIFNFETSKFYKESLQELEDHMKSEFQSMLLDIRVDINEDYLKLKTILESEKRRLDRILKSKLDQEVNKTKQYYELLLQHILHKNNKIINQVQVERNATLKAYLAQMEAENTTNTMYVLCEERRKCKIHKFMIKNHMAKEISEKIDKIKTNQQILDSMQIVQSEVSLNKLWEEKLRKIMQLFLKFIGFSLKLLPEQATFLIDLEKMVVLQLNEILKSPLSVHSILVEKNNSFNFQKLDPEQIFCNEKPFELIGDMSNDVPTQYDSKETIPSNVSLPYIRVGRKIVYAKCKDFEKVKDLLKSQQCKCHLSREEENIEEVQGSKDDVNSIAEIFPENPITFPSSEFFIQQMLIDDIYRLKECPVRKCSKISTSYTCLPMDSFLDFSEENYKKLKLVNEVTSESPMSSKDLIEEIKPVDIVTKEVPFAETKERYRNAGTQYSSQESVLDDHGCACPCICNGATVNKSLSNKSMNDITQERKLMLNNLIHSHPRLLNIIFTEESFNLPF